jgi:iron-sulfur cluster assembly protein
MTDKTYSVSISPLAALKVKEKMLSRGTADCYLRLGVKGGGCSGLTYVLEYEDSPKEKDLIFESEDIKIVVDKKSILYLNGTILNWEQKLLYTGFKFNNPQEISKCGCGHSIVINKEQS